MKLSLLIIASIQPGIFASIEELRSEFDKSLFDAPRIVGMKGVESFLANFCLDRDIDRVSSMLEYRKFPYQKIYERIGESPERQNQLFEE